MVITRATLSDLDAVVRLLSDASAWLRSRGLDQWPEGFAPPERVRPYIACAEMWLVWDGETPAATVRVTSEADAPGLWTPAERAELALHVSKLAIDRRYAGRGLGESVLRWVTDYASRLGYRWARLDAWRTNTGLHDYYLSRGWEHVRTVETSERNSTALFQRAALPDPEVRSMFSERHVSNGWHEAGTRVEVISGQHCGTGTITAIYAPYDQDVVRSLEESGADNLPGYWVRLDGSRWPVLCYPADVRPLTRAAE